MIYKIITYFILPCMCLALLLAFIGVQKVEFDNTYMDFIRGVSMRLESWSFKVPNIPKIPTADSGSGGFIETIVKILNGIVDVINVLVMLVNVVITLIQFVLTLIYCVIDFRDTMVLTGVNGDLSSFLV